MGLLDELEQQAQQRKANADDAGKRKSEREEIFRTQLDHCMDAAPADLGKLIDFQALSIEFDLEDSRFQARFEIDVLPFKVGDALPGAIRFGTEHITTAVIVQR